MWERASLERETADLLVPVGPAAAAERETEKGLFQKSKVLVLLPHKITRGASNVDLTPAQMDPGFYDGTDEFKIAPPPHKLQTCLEDALKKPAFKSVKAAALADLTKDILKPEFAGVRHKTQLYVASTSKVAAMLAAYQLRNDLRVLAQTGSPKPTTKDELFSLARDGWVAAQAVGAAGTFTRSIALRGKRVMVGGSPVSIWDPAMPRLDNIFKVTVTGGVFAITYKSTGEDLATLKALVKSYNQASGGLFWARKQLTKAKKARDDAVAKSEAAARLEALGKAVEAAEKAVKKAEPPYAVQRRKLRVLGFKEQLDIAIGGDVPASNTATSDVVGELGFGYMASVLLQTGLYDPARGGGLWLGARYGGNGWRGALAGGPAQSGTAGSLVAFMTLLAQERLVEAGFSKEMQDLMVKVPALTVPGTGSWLNIGLRGKGLTVTRLLGKVGLDGGADEIGFVCRELEVDDGSGGKKKVQLRYAVAILRANAGDPTIQDLIVEMDKCILANNGLTLAQGGHPPP